MKLFIKLYAITNFKSKYQNHFFSIKVFELRGGMEQLQAIICSLRLMALFQPLLIEVSYL